MLKYAKIINETKGLVDVGLGTNITYYQSIGMTEMDVEQSDVDNKWYTSAKCPHKTPEQKLTEAKTKKYNEANEGAKTYLEEGRALYEYEPNRHVEATKDNMNTIGLKSVALILAQDYTTTFPWNTKEDVNIYLNALQGKELAEALGDTQQAVWTVKFPYYKNLIDNATTVEQVEAIEIDYDSEVFDGNI